MVNDQAFRDQLKEGDEVQYLIDDPQYYINRVNEVEEEQAKRSNNNAVYRGRVAWAFYKMHAMD